MLMMQYVHERMLELVRKSYPRGQQCVRRLGECNLCDYTGCDIPCAWNDGGLQG